MCSSRVLSPPIWKASPRHSFRSPNGWRASAPFPAWKNANVLFECLTLVCHTAMKEAYKTLRLLCGNCEKAWPQLQENNIKLKRTNTRYEGFHCKTLQNSLTDIESPRAATTLISANRTLCTLVGTVLLLKVTGFSPSAVTVPFKSAVFSLKHRNSIRTELAFSSKLSP